MVKDIILICISCVGLISCKSYTLQFEQETYKGNLRTNGYYYNILEQEDKTLTRLIFLYNNGVTYRENYVADDLDYVEQRILDTAAMAQSRRYIFLWGIFKADQENLVINNFAISAVGRIPNILIPYEIVNDSTLRDKNDNHIYKFKQFTPKPDSTNEFVEYYKYRGN